jgi:hypothetical protein
MKFECGDLDRALEQGQLMPEAREHLKNCPACRKEYRLWNDISATARELHEQWDTPGLWPSIENALRQQTQISGRRAWWVDRKTWAIAAAFAACAAALLFVFAPWRQQTPPSKTEAQAVVTPKDAPAARATDRDFLTDQALAEVERTESAYRESIEKLSRIAAPELRNPHNAVATNCSEKLKMLDAAITETRANLARNRYNIHLQTALANLYREKKQTLEELLTRDQRN